MEKSAEFIRKKEFHIVFKGYKPEEVDKFLDILSVEFDRLLKRNRELQDSLDKLKFENTDEDTDIKKVIQDALISAHKVAEDIKAQAKREADSIIDQRKAIEDRSLHDIEMKKLAMDESLIVLQGKYDDFKNRIKKTILDMTQFVDEAGIGMEENEYTETDFTDLKSYAGRHKDFDGNNKPVQKMTSEEVTTEPQQEPETLPGQNSLNENLKTGESASTDSSPKKNVFDNYNLNSQRESGSYFERIQNQNLEQERKSSKERDLNSKSSDPQTEDLLAEDPQTEDVRKADEDVSSPKRERKKIDIANPDIIENFFKTSED